MWSWQKIKQYAIVLITVYSKTNKEKTNKVPTHNFWELRGICESIFFTKEHLMQYTNVKFWRSLKLHIGPKNLHFYSNVQLLQDYAILHTAGVMKQKFHCKALDHLSYSPKWSYFDKQVGKHGVKWRMGKGGEFSISQC